MWLAELLNPTQYEPIRIFELRRRRYKRQSRDSGLCDNETIIGIRKSCKGSSLEEQLHVVDPQIEVVCLHKRNDQVAEWQGNANFAGFGKKQHFFENGKRNKYAIDSRSTLSKMRRAPGPRLLLRPGM